MSNIADKAPPTLADLIGSVEKSEALPVRRRADIVCDLRRLSAVIGAAPSDLCAGPADLRRRLRGVSPAGCGLSPTRWRNMKCSLNKALRDRGPRDDNRTPDSRSSVTGLERITRALGRSL